MRVRPILASALLLPFLLVLPSPPPASAFFDVLDQLKEQLKSGEKTTSDLDNIIKDLEQVTGPRFNDTEKDSWYDFYVGTVAKWGIVSGYKNERGELTGNFGPGDPVTVAQFLKMALKAAKVDETACVGLPYHAGASGHWAERFVVCAEDLGVRVIQRGVPLDQPALRGEVLTIIHDAFKHRVPPLLSTFRDTAGHLYESDIAFAAARGVVSGDTKDGVRTGNFRPNDGLKRAEAVKIIFEQLKAYVLSRGE